MNNTKEHKQFNTVLKELYRYFYHHQYDERFPTFRCADMMTECDEFGDKIHQTVEVQFCLNQYWHCWNMLQLDLMLSHASYTYDPIALEGPFGTLPSPYSLEYRQIKLFHPRPSVLCYLSAALCYSAVMLETQSMHAVVSNLVKEYRYCSLVLPVHVQ